MQISSRDYAYLNDLSQVRFLVIDEADRMIQQGSFPQLVRILDEIHKANPMNDSDQDVDEEQDDHDDHHGGAQRLGSLPGIRGEAKVQMLDTELLQQLQLQQTQRGGSKEDVGVVADNDHDDEVDETDQETHQPVELDDEEYERLRLEQEALEAGSQEDDDISLPLPPPVRRQTFVYSATLTLPSTTATAGRTASKKKTPQKKGAGAMTVDGAIAELLEKARAKGPTKIVDLTTSSKALRSNPSEGKSSKSATANKTSSHPSARLPPGLTLEQITCTQKHKDSHLYAYLVTTTQGSSGPALVFCNSIMAVRRVGTTLQTLGLTVRILHAHMPQVR
jgi:ATP-dependent RNA helicase DDX24/MAK5